MKNLILIIIMAFSITECKNSPQTNITFLCTTDTHGAINGYSYESMRDTMRSLSNISTYVTEERQKNPDLILLDCGDFMQGEPTNAFYNYIDTNDLNIVSVMMNFMKYDAATVGNHDIEAGHPVYDKVQAECQFPWLSANAIDIRNGKPYFKPYHIITRNGIRIAILGMTTPGIPKWLPKYLWEHIEFTDMIECAHKWVPYIQENERPDILIGLFHSGYNCNYDNENALTPCNENASLLVAEQVDGFDAVIYGHDHAAKIDSLTNQAGNQVIMLNAGNRCNHIGRIDIDIHDGQKFIRVELIDTDSLSKDSLYEETVTPYIKKVKSYNLDIIGRCEQRMDAREAVFGACAFTDLVHNVQLDVTGAEVSLTSPMRLHTEMNVGRITVGDIFKIYRFDNRLYVMEFSGKDIYNYLEYSASLQYNTMTSESDPLLRLDSTVLTNGKRSFFTKIPYYHFSNAAGIKYTVDVSKPDGQRIQILSMSDGTPFDMTKTYRVAINSYRANGGGKHLTTGVGWSKEDINNHIIKIMPSDIRHYITEYIRAQNNYAPKTRNDSKVVPENWVAKAQKREYKLLFNN